MWCFKDRNKTLVGRITQLNVQNVDFRPCCMDTALDDHQCNKHNSWCYPTLPNSKLTNRVAMGFSKDRKKTFVGTITLRFAAFEIKAEHTEGEPPCALLGVWVWLCRTADPVCIFLVSKALFPSLTPAAGFVVADKRPCFQVA